MLRVGSEGRRTHQGRQRRINEDSHFARAPLYVVADGMGGAQAGEVASGVAVDVFQRGLPDGPGSAEERLVGLVQEANAQIHDLSRSDADRAGMGTTLTAAYLGEDELSVAHVGDSRLYRLRGDEFTRLTRDHSLVEELVQEGKLTPEEADEHPQRSIITRALGPEGHVAVDHLTVRAQPGDVFLLCSDGLTSMVAEARIAGIVRAAASLQAAADDLVDAANAAGGRDNITVLLFDVEEVGGAPAEAPTGVEQTVAGATAPRTEDVRAAIATAPAPGTAAAAGPVARRVPRAPGPPPAPARRRGWVRRHGFGLVVVLGLLVAVVTGAYFASQTVYFVGADQGFVTLYRGMPYELPAGIRLYTVNYTSGVPVGTLPPRTQTTIKDHKLRSHGDAVDLVRQLERGTIQENAGR